MNDIFWGALTILVNTIPSMILTYIPFRKKIRVKPVWAFAFNTALFVVYIAGYISFALSHSSYNFLQAYKLTLIIPGVIIAFAMINESKFKIFYFNLMMITYIVIAAKLANFLIFRIYENPGSFEHALINVLVFSVTLPLMLLYQNWIFKRTEEAVETYTTDIWKIIWIVPLLFVLLCLSNNWRFEPAVIREPAFIIINLMTAAGMIISTSVLLQVLKLMTETSLLRENTKVAEQQLIMQGEQYKMMVENTARTNAARHDLRHHLSVIASYADQGDTQALQKYLTDYQGTLHEDSEEFYCDNGAVNAIVRHYGNVAKERGIELDIHIQIPRKISISDLDLSVIFGNCMENAIEACSRLNEGASRVFRIKTRLKGQTFAVIFINSFDGQVLKKDETFLSRKHSGAGIGLSSVAAAAKKYEGTAQFEVKENEFWVSVLLFLPKPIGIGY